jgi:hypothetical protein
MSQEAIQENSEVAEALKVVVDRKALVSCYKFVSCTAPSVDKYGSLPYCVGVYSKSGRDVYYGALSGCCMFLFKNDLRIYTKPSKNKDDKIDVHLDFFSENAERTDNFMQKLTKEKSGWADISGVLAKTPSNAVQYLDILNRFMHDPRDFVLRNVNVPYEFPVRVKYATGFRLEEMRMHAFMREDHIEKFAETGVYEMPIYFVSDYLYLDYKGKLSIFESGTVEPFEICFIVMPYGFSSKEDLKNVQNSIYRRMDDFILPQV